MTCPSDFCRVRVTSPSSQSHLNFFEWCLSLVKTWSSQVRVESQELSSHFESLVCKLNSMSSQMKFHIFSMTFYAAAKWRPTFYKMAPGKLEMMPTTLYEMVPDKLENDAQCFIKFECRLFISKLFQFAFYLSLSISVISVSVAEFCCKCCKLSFSTVLSVRFITNGMSVENNTHIYVAQTSRYRMSMTCNLCCCLLPQCEALYTCRSGFPIATKWCCDQGLKVLPGAPTVDEHFCNTNCRFLLAIIFRTWGPLCVNLSFAPNQIRRESSCARIRCADGRPRFQDSTSRAVSCRPRVVRQLFVPASHVVPTRWLFLLSHHHQSCFCCCC